MRAEVQPHGEGRRRGASLLDVHSLVCLDREEIPDRARGNELAGLEDDRIEEPVVVDAEDTAAVTAAACMRSAAAAVVAIGFSTSTCTPRSSAAIAVSAWLEGGVRTWTASSGRRSRSAASRHTSSAPASARRRAPLEIHVTDPDDANARRRLEVAAMDAGDAAAADQADTNFGRGSAHAWVEK